LNSEPSSHDLIWQEIRDSLYILYLTYWKEIKEEYDELSEGSEGSVGSEPNRILQQISDRERELWKPIICLALFFDKYILPSPSQPTLPSQPSLEKAIIEFALQKVKEKQVENVTETRELVLIQTLLEVVQADGYYKAKIIKEAMAQKYEEEQKWLNTQWIGRALKRLGFTEKRRVGTGREYLFKRQQVEDLAIRLGIVPQEKAENSFVQQNSQKENSIQQVCRVGLSEENFSLVYGKLRELCRSKLYATTEELEYATGIGKETLTAILQAMQREGKIIEYHQGCWRVNA